MTLSNYEPTGITLIRTPLLPVQDYPTAVANKAEATRQKMRDLLERPEVREAIAIASKSLYFQLEQWRADGGPERFDKKGWKVESSLLRYLIRMSSRPTPFGIFSGVALGDIRSDMDIDIAKSDQHRTNTVVDLELLWAIVQRVEQDRDIIKELHLRTNPHHIIAGERLYLNNQNRYGQGINENTSLRFTPVVKEIIEFCRVPHSLSNIADFLLEKFDVATPERVQEAIKNLHEVGVLLSDLRPPLMGTRPLNYVLEKLNSLDKVIPEKELMHDFQQTSEKIDSLPIGKRTELFNDLRRLPKALDTKTKDVFKVDLKTTLPENHLSCQVADDMTTALTLLVQQGTYGARRLSLQSYQQRFVERYGGREVPIMELLDNSLGLGAPEGYRHPVPIVHDTKRPNVEHVEKRKARRETLLLRYLQRNSGKQEITLSNQEMKELTVFDSWEDNLPISGELFATVIASSQDAINQGDYKIAISPRVCTDRAGKTFGRFHEILGDELAEHLKDAYQREEKSAPDCIFAEVSYLPYNARLLNVAVKPCTQNYEIPIGVTPSVAEENVIHLDDIFVGVKGHRFYLRSKRFNKELKVQATHVLNSLHAPNVVRFLEDVTQDGEQLSSNFDWGAAKKLTFLPRLSVGRCILSLRTWNILRSSLPKMNCKSSDEDLGYWAQELRSTYQVDRWVSWGENDSLLTLDLDNPLHIRLLLEDLDKFVGDDLFSLQEALLNPDTAWQNAEDASYVQEFVLPVRQREQRIKQPIPFLENKQEVSGLERFKPFGSEWLYLKLYDALIPEDELLVQHIQPFVQTLECIDRWFFIRYADPKPHLRLRFFCMDPENRNELIRRVSQWSQDLVNAGHVNNMLVDSYDREIERYGGIESMTVSEHLFAFDSTGIIEAIKGFTTDISENAIAQRAILLCDQLLDGFGYELQDKQNLLTKIRESQSSTFGYKDDGVKRHLREHHRSLKQMLVDTRLWSEKTLPTPLSEALLARYIAFQDCAHQLRALELNGLLQISPEDILTSYLHMTCNRLGLSREAEYEVIVMLERCYDGLKYFTNRANSYPQIEVASAAS